MSEGCSVVPGASANPAPAQRRWRDAQGEHIDVRGLQPPQPLVDILRLVQEQAAVDATIIVHHDRDPVLLYAELTEIGWSAERLDGGPGQVLLRLRRDA